MGVPPTVRLRDVQGRSGGHIGQTGESRFHQPAMFQVQIHSREQSPTLGRIGRIPVLEVQVLTSRGLQRGEKYRPEVSPIGANLVGWRRIRKRTLESRDVEREWRLRVCR